MNAKNLKTGMKVKMSGGKSIIKVLSTCSQNSHEGNNFWFRGEVIDLCGSKENEFNYIGYKSLFNVDFAQPV